jgi:hypothetical protein
MAGGRKTSLLWGVVVVNVGWVMEAFARVARNVCGSRFSTKALCITDSSLTRNERCADTRCAWRCVWRATVARHACAYHNTARHANSGDSSPAARSRSALTPSLLDPVYAIAPSMTTLLNTYLLLPKLVDGRPANVPGCVRTIDKVATSPSPRSCASCLVGAAHARCALCSSLFARRFSFDRHLRNRKGVYEHSKQNDSWLARS